MDDHADDLLRRALIDQDAAAAVALRVGGLPLCDALTIVFHGRRDLGTIQTYITHGQRGAGSAVGPDELLRVPCDLDLASARDRDEAEELYAEQAADDSEDQPEGLVEQLHDAEAIHCPAGK